MIPLDEYLASKSPEFRKEVDKQYSEMAMEFGRNCKCLKRS